MKKILSLSKVMFKDSFSGLGSGSKKKQKGWKKTLGLIGMIGLYAVLTISMFFTSRDLLKLFIEMGQEKQIIDTIFSGVSLFFLLISVLTIPAVFYFSKDVEILLAMPIKAYEILIAKTITTYMNLLMGASFILIPFGITYQFVVAPPVYFLLFYFLAILILPIIPLVISITLVVIVFRFMPMVNNKDMFTYFSSFIVFGIIFGMQFFTSPDGNMFGGLVSESSSINQTVAMFIPTASMLANGVKNYNILLIALALVISAVFVYIVNSLIGGLYFKAAIGSSERSTKRKPKKVKVISNDKKISSQMVSIMKTDTRNILRNPAFAINYILPMLILPLFMIVPASIGLSSEGVDMEMVKAAIVTLQQSLGEIELKTIITFAIIISFVLTFFIGSMSTITSTSISREGENMEFYKILPIPMLIVINSKILLGIIISLVLPLIILIGVSLILKLNILVVIISLVTILITVVFSNLLDMLVDVFFPKLVWDNETQALKQNFYTMIPIFGSFIIIGMLAFVFFFFEDSLLVSAIVILAIAVSISVLVYMLIIPKYGLKRLDNAIEEL